MRPEKVTNSRKRSMLAQSSASVVNGASNGILIIVLPIFLVRLLPRDEYAIWALLIQFIAYVTFFRFAIQTAVGRYIAEARILGQQEAESEVINAALALLAGCSLFGLILTLVTTWKLNSWFPQIPDQLRHDAIIAFVVLGTTMSFGMLTTTMSGYLTGTARYDILAAVNLGGRLLTCAVVVCMAFAGTGIVGLAIGWCAGVVITYGGLIYGVNQIGGHLKITLRCLNGKRIKALLTHGGSMTVWSLGMLLVSGIDIPLVAHYDFGSVAYYTLAADLMMLLAGLQNAVFSPLIPAAAALNARDDSRHSISQVLLKTTRYSLYLLLASGSPLLFLTRPCLQIWVGASYAEHTATILQILAAANIIRLVATPYAVLLIGTGEQHKVLTTPIVEGVINLSASMWLGYHLGAIGVAWGTLFGAVAAMACNLIYNMPRTPTVSASVSQYIRTGIGRPLLAFTPLLVLFATASWDANLTAPIRLLLLGIGTPLSGFLLFTFGFDSTEKGAALAHARFAWDRIALRCFPADAHH